MIEKVLIQILSEDEVVVAAVSSNEVPLIFLSSHDANAQNLPCLLLQSESSTAEKILSGEVITFAGSYRILCLAPTMANVDELAQAVINSLHSYRGIVAEKRVLKLLLESKETLTRTVLEGDALPRHGIALDFEYRITN